MPNLTTIHGRGRLFRGLFRRGCRALTVVLAVGLARGWRAALTGAAALSTPLIVAASGAQRVRFMPYG